MSPRYLTPQEVADYLRISRSAVYWKIGRGEIEAAQVGRQWRIPVGEIEKITGHPYEPPPPEPDR
jgi:excisionase family DNA binding protein